MTYARRSYLPSHLHRRVYGPTPRYGSEYQRVYGSAQALASVADPVDPVSAPSPQLDVQAVDVVPATRLAAAA